jgi:hypothetical protein
MSSAQPESCLQAWSPKLQFWHYRTPVRHPPLAAPARSTVPRWRGIDPRLGPRSTTHTGGLPSAEAPIPQFRTATVGWLGEPMIWLKVVGIVLVVLAFDIAVGAGALIAVSLLSTARRLVLWIGVGSLGFGLLSAVAGVLFVNRAYKWHGDSNWRSLPKG